MPTNDERREVAHRVRSVVDGPVHIDRLVNALGLAYAQGKLLGFYVSESSVRRLADLIESEPERTCHMKFDTVHCDFVCSRCGAWVRTDASRTINGASLKYCPNCGAKVVDK